MDFYYGRISGNSARVAFALNEAGATFRARLVDTASGENQSPEYLSVNPMGKIPALVDGNLKLWESNAINWYVAEKLPNARLLPNAIDARASVQRWLFFQAAHVSPASITIFRATNARVQAFWKTSGDPRAVEAAHKELGRYFPVLEGVLANRSWLEGDFSLADIAYAPHSFLLVEGGFDIARYPRVRSWLERLWARSAWKKAAEMIFGS